MTVLKDVLRDLLMGSMDDFFSNVGPEELKKYQSFRYLPVFKSNGNFDDQRRITHVNTRQMIRNCDMGSKPYYRNAFDELQVTVSEKCGERNQQDPKEITHKELRDFMISYFDDAGFVEFDETKFLRNFQIFERHLTAELNTRYCFATLLNFNGNFEKLNLDNSLHIRRIAADEFVTISGIENHSEKIDVDHSLFKIKYVIGKTMDSTRVRESNVLKLFEKTLDALKVFRNGNVQIGGLYFRDSEFWKIKPTHVLRREPRTPPTKEYTLNSGKALNNFVLFHKKFLDINFTKGKYTFLGRSIRRFSNAIEDSSPEESIVDFVISLESLYTSNELELSYKFSLRVAVLLGTSPREMAGLQRMMYDIYNMRSRIVHGDEIPTQIKLEKKSLEMKQAVEILEHVSRNSIMIFLELLEEYGPRDIIHRNIEVAIFDSEARSKISDVIKSSEYIDLKFLEELT